MTLPGSTGEVWTALHDPDTLARSIPACKGVERVDDGIFRAVFEAEFGGMQASYEGEIRFREETPNSYSRVLISGEGPLGPVSGDGELWLSPSGEGTIVKYRVEVKLGGGLGWLGGRMFEGAANKMAVRFFEGVGGCERASSPSNYSGVGLGYGILIYS